MPWLKCVHKKGLESGAGESSGTGGSRLLTIHEFAARTGLSESTVRRLFRRRQIDGFQPGGPGTKIVFPPDAIERTAANLPHTNQGVPQVQRSRRGPKPRVND